MKKLISIILLSYTSCMYTMHHTYNTNNLIQDPNHSTRMKVNIEVVTTSHSEITFTITQAFLNNNNILDLKNMLTQFIAKKILLYAKDTIEEQLEYEHNINLQDRRNHIMQLIEQSDTALTVQEISNLSMQASDHANFCYYSFEH